MTPEITSTAWQALLLGGWIAGGFVLGMIYFSIVRRSAHMLVAGSAVGFAMSLVVLRVALLVGGLYLAAVCGTLSLLAAAGGVLIGRGVVLRQNPGAA